jgi:hypothetical protein
MTISNNFSIGISLTCFKRADYLDTVLKSLKKAIEYIGSDNTFVFYPSIDYNNDKVVKLITDIDWVETKYICNKPPIGCNKNTLQAISRAIKDHDAVLHLEDDTVLSEDALGFYLYSLEKYKDDPEVLSVSGYNKTEELNDNEYFTLFQEKFFCCWGCAFWKSKAKTILQNWTPQLNFMNPQSWDTYIHENIFKNKYFQVRPKLSRVQNIGAKNGTYVHDPVWHYYNQRSPYTSTDITTTIGKTWKEYAKDS